MTTSAAALEFNIDPSGGAGFRQLRDSEREQLKSRLQEICEQETKISAEEIEIKKGIVNWLLGLLKDQFRPRIIQKLFRAGSAYEKVQAGEANDFDVMAFMNVWKGRWRVQDDPERPGFCSIKWLGEKKITSTAATSSSQAKKSEPAKQGSAKKERRHEIFLKRLLDEDGYLSSLKVRRFFTSQTDKILRKNKPLKFKYKPKPKEKKFSDKDPAISSGTKVEERAVEIEVIRLHRGPATTLMIKCPELDIAPFSLDIVNSLHSRNVSHKAQGKCDFVAKPYDKQKIFDQKFGHLWRKSYSRQEVDKFKSIDEGNQIHRKMLRIFKILKANQSQLKLLKTYTYKNTLLFLSDVKGRQWTDSDIADRFVDMVIALRNSLSTTPPRLPVYFNTKVNLLSEHKDNQLKRIMGYLRRIANKGIDGYKELLSMKEQDHHRKQQ